MITDYTTIRPRRCSAGTRRHHHKTLPYKLRLIVPTVARIRVTPVWWSESDQSPMEGVFTVVVIDGNDQAMHPTVEDTAHIVALLQGSFTADWTLPQTWDAATNTLRTDRPDMPAEMRGAA
ncbi:hypothetical protein [Streptomyces sp. 5-6(2022)]|uniref:hypothetical protein n=1 Tax=Streptomyces sp. 5-6(2022) TaxID=2936510 RepID=UPI0023B8D5B5|nr:hypothetical protein [Streptomyces sp. 5-6(2022)]